MKTRTQNPDIVGKIWVNKHKTTGEVLNLGLKISAEALASLTPDQDGQVSLIAFKNKFQVAGKNHPSYNVLVSKPRTNGGFTKTVNTTKKNVEVNAEEL